MSSVTEILSSIVSTLLVRRFCLTFWIFHFLLGFSLVILYSTFLKWSGTITRFGRAPREWSQRGKTGSCKGSAQRLRMRLGTLKWKAERRIEITYLFPRLAWPVGGEDLWVLVMIGTNRWGKEGQASPITCYFEPTSDVNRSNPTYWGSGFPYDFQIQVTRIASSHWKDKTLASENEKMRMNQAVLTSKFQNGV